MANKNLQNAKKAKNDEFYTELTDVSKELINRKALEEEREDYEK